MLRISAFPVACNFAANLRASSHERSTSSPTPLRPSDFSGVADADPAADFVAFHETCQRSRELVADASLTDTYTDERDLTFTLRWIYLHMLEEYARHNGHADLLRERIDGKVGQ